QWGTSGAECLDCGSTDWDAVEQSNESQSAFQCVVDGQEYEYADFHILTTDGTDVCSERSTYLPTAEGDYQGLFCSQTDTNTVRAIFNWNNGSRNKTLSWLVDVERIGSRTKAGVPCESADETVARRCANQLSSGKRAFRGMLGEGGAGIRNLNIANLTSLEEMFFQASNFNEDITGWDISHVESLRRLFEKTNFNRDVGKWDTSSVKNLSATFNTTPFNHDIGDWDTSQVETMVYMFTNANQFDQDISKWNTSNVNAMAYMFQNTARFDQDISTKTVTGENGESYTAWDVSGVTNMASMFQKAEAFNQDLSGWNVLGVTSEPSGFKSNATNWSGVDPDTQETWCNKGQPQWGTDGAECVLPRCSDVTEGEWALASTDPEWICRIDGDPYEYADFHILTSNDTNVCSTPESYLPTDDNNGQGLFCVQAGSTVRAIYDWENGFENQQKHSLKWLASVAQIGSRSGTGCGALGSTAAGRCANQLKEGQNAFRGMAGAGGSAIENLDTSNLTNIEHIFQDAAQFNANVSAKEVNASGVSYVAWDVSGVERINSAFNGATNFNNGGQPLYWDTQSVWNMGYTFYGASSFDQPISAGAVTIGDKTFTAWDTSKVQFLDNAFHGAAAFNQDLSSWDTGKVTKLENVFKNAFAFNNGDVAGASSRPLNWNTPLLSALNYAFAYASAFNQQIFANGASTAKVLNMSAMFKGATAFNQNIGNWNTQSVTDTKLMFQDATAFNQDIGSWSMGGVTSINAMFKNAKAFNQDLSDWAIDNPAVDVSSFDEGADAWCGLGFSNRGRPGAVSPSEAESCALSLVIDAPPSAVAGGQFDYVLRYYNESSTDFDTGTLSLTLPTGLSVVDEGDGTATGQTVSWTGLTVPAGSSSDGGGGEQSVTVKVDAGVSDGAALEASATLSDGAAIAVNDVATVFATSQAVLNTVIRRSDKGGDYVFPGETIEYQVIPENTGLSNTEGGQLAIAWSGGVPFTIETSNGATCTDTECELALDLDADGGKHWTRFTIRVGADAPSGGVLTATASMTATNAVSDSTASITTEVDALPELAVAMETLPAAVVGLGDEFKVIVEVANVGSVGAGATNVTLSVPNGAIFVSASGGGAESGGVISWTLTSLDKAETSTFLVSLRAPNATGAMTLKAEAATTFTSPNGSTREISDDKTESLRVDDAPVLDLQLAMSPDPAAPGDELAMAFTYQNVGHLPAEAVTLTFKVPVDTTMDLDKSYPDSGVCSADPCGAGSTVTYNLGTLQGQSSGEVRAALDLDNNTTELAIAGAGALTGTNGGAALLPQAASAQVQVVNGPILVVTQRADRDYVPPGGLVTYQIDYENRGLATATSVVLDDDIPSDTRVQAAPGASETASGVRWSTDSLAEGQSGSVMTRLEVAGNAELDGTLTNVVTLSDANQAVHAAPYDVTVVDGPVLATDLDTFPSFGAPGKPYLYTVRYTNKGTAEATNATLQLAVPADVTVGDCDGCALAGNRLTWDLGTVASDATDSKQVVVTVNADVPEYTTLYAASYISAGAGQRKAQSGTLKQAVLRLLDDQRDGARAAGSDRTTTSQRPGPLTLASTLVARAPATAIAVTATDQVIRGGQIAVEAVISNTGSATATNATVETELPDGTQLAYLGSGGTCSAPCVAGSTLSWDLGTLVPGAERTISYSLSVDANADLGERRHVLELDSTEENPQIGEATTNVVAGALTLDKSVTDAGGTLNPTYAEIGDVVTYTLTVDNESPSAAPDLVVTDVLPAEVIACGSSCLNLSGSGASLSGNTLTWSNIDLDAREGITLSYSVTIPNVANNTTLENVANVRSTIGQSDSDSARLVITAIAELGVTLAAPAGLQPDESGSVVMTYQNTGTAATTATLSYLLPDKLSVTDSAGATVSGATYSWSLGSLAAGASGSKTLTVKAAADAPTNEVLTHFASLEGSASNLTADATDTTVIGSIEELAISVSAPSPQTTGDTFTATVVATNSGNTAANGTVVKLTLPAGFT
ncbi:MAG: BspA family leucine-rich repeat surface protein, partial [Luminiphilus sp.]